MFRTNSFMKASLPAISLAVILFSSQNLYAESFFLRNGNIIEGVITGEDDSAIRVRIPAGDDKKIARKDIMRVLVHDRYKYKQYLTKTDGSRIEGYIVDEDNSSYTLRSELNSPAELKISRNKVEVLSTKKNPERFTAPPVYSSVFIKDGNIIDCRINRETIDDIEIRSLSGEKRIISRQDIIRIHYNNSYRDKKILNKTDGTRIEAYIMDEDYTSYIYRSELSSPEEKRIYKNELKSISRR